MSSKISLSARPQNMPAINFLPWRAMSRLPVVLQSEVTECGLACLTMVVNYFGLRTDLAAMRDRLGTSQNGVTLNQLILQSSRLGLSSQAVRAELESLKYLKAPCILHWGMDHFVVLKKANRRKVVIHDPKVGEVALSYAQASDHFTGIAIEFQPNEKFEIGDERKVPTLRSIVGNTRGLYRGLTHIFLLALLLQVIALISPAGMQWLIDNGLNSGERSLIVTIVAGMGLLMLIQLVLGTIRSWMVMYLTMSVGFQWSSRILTHLLHLPIDFFEKRHVGDVMSRFGSVSSIQQTVTMGVIEGVIDGIVGIATLVMIWLYSPTLAMTAIGAIVALVLLQFLTFEPMKRIANEALVTDARVSTNFLESMRGIRSLKLATRMNQRRMAWQGLAVDSINVKVRQQWFGIVVGNAAALISGAQRLIAIFIAAMLISRGEFTVGMLFAYLAYQDQFMSGTGGLVKLYFDFKMMRLHFERLSDIVLTEPEDLAHLDKDGDGDKPIVPMTASAIGETGASVDFRDVSFRYSEFASDVLNGLSFSTAGSRCTVIAGRTGAGKTTIFKLMLGIYRPSSGKILINGLPIESIPVEDLRSSIACVLQDDVLFAGSIRENIAFFESEIDQARVEECAAIACLHEDIGRMPMGYYTLIGDMGSTLSAGQKQRLLIARALYRKPKILLLDEATSDLDVSTELRINQNLSELSLHRIYIAHRPQTIAFGDQVVMLDGDVVKA